MARPLTARPPWSAPVHVVALGAGVGAVGLVPLVGGAVGALTLLWSWAARAPRAAVLLCLAPIVLALGVPWPVPALVALVAARLVAGRAPPDPAPGPAHGALRPLAETVLLAAACAPAAALLAARSLGNDHQVIALHRPAGLVLAAGVVLVAVLNAAVEEWFWRGRAIRLLIDDGQRRSAVVAWQAVSFGVAHAAGVPGGVTGIAGAAVLGLALGVLRQRRAGLAGCVAAHAVVDVAIFAGVVGHVVWVGH